MPRRRLDAWKEDVGVAAESRAMSLTLLVFPYVAGAFGASMSISRWWTPNGDIVAW